MTLYGYFLVLCDCQSSDMVKLVSFLEFIPLHMARRSSDIH
jgi:hypothetical protein